MQLNDEMRCINFVFTWKRGKNISTEFRGKEFRHFHHFKTHFKILIFNDKMTVLNHN